MATGMPHAPATTRDGYVAPSYTGGAPPPRRRRWKRAVLATVAVVALLAAVVVVRTMRFGAPQVDVRPVAPVAIPAGAAERLAGAVRIPTISHADPAAFDPAAFQALHAYLRDAFPRVHAQLAREVVGAHSLLYTWRGSDPSLPPILIAAHLDVVPVEPGTEQGWTHDAFGGRIAQGYVWGRGAIDNKSAVVGSMEAVEMLLAEGFAPARTIMLAYGHDEEVGGLRGAREIAALLARRGVRLESVLDEGGVIGDGVMPGVAAPTALVGIAEKGYLGVELTTRTEGGHSSLPPREGAIGILGAAVARLEARPMPARLEGPSLALFEHVAPGLPFAQRAAFANLWAARPLVLRTLEGAPSTNAMVRTTTAVTIFEAGTKENVLPSRARAIVNFRIHPADSIAGVLAHVRRAVDDGRVEVRQTATFSAEPSRISTTTSASYRTLERTIREVAPDAIVAPYLVVVVADARHYAALGPDTYRFLPLRLVPRDLRRMHGTDERLAIGDYENAIRFYRRFMVNAAGRQEARGSARGSTP